MPAIQTQITSYEVVYSSNTFPPRIWLSNGVKPIGQLIFMRDGVTLPPDNESAGQANLYYHLQDFPNVFRLLSEEKITVLYFFGSGGAFENGIRTPADPVGNLP